MDSDAPRLLLIEGAWSTGAGLRAQEVLAALPASVTPTAVERLDGVADYWGKEVGDERYLVVGNDVETV